MTNVEKPRLTPGPNVRHEFREVSITLSGIDAGFSLVPDPLPDGDPPTDHPGNLNSYYRKKEDTTPAAGSGKKIYWLVGFHFIKSDKNKMPTFTIELPVVPNRAETEFYYLEKGRLIYLGKTTRGGKPVPVSLTLDDPSVGMT